MGNVVPMNPVRPGEPAFMMCPCKPEDPEPYLAVALVSEKPIVIALVCPECESQLDIIDGQVQ